MRPGWDGARGRPGIARRLTFALVGAAFAASSAFAPHAMASCHHHAPAGHPASHAPPVELDGHAAHGAPHDDSPAKGPADGGAPGTTPDHEDTPCGCLGDCCPGADTAYPGPASAAAAALDGPVGSGTASPQSIAPRLSAWTLPYPNAPPRRA